MMLNAYTAALDNIHAPAGAVERAIAEAKRRAAASAAARAKTRYAAAAASLVLASAAGVSVFYMFSRSPEPPTAPPASSSSESLTEAVSPTSPVAGSESVPTQAVLTEAPTASAVTESPTQSSYTAETTADPEPQPAETSAPADETEAPEAPTEQPTTVITDVPRIDVEVDSSLLCEDGKLYCVIAPTGYDVSSDPDAFDDDRIYYVETKFGRYPQYLPFKITDPYLPYDDMNYTFYNSAGTIVRRDALSVYYQRPFTW